MEQRLRVKVLPGRLSEFELDHFKLNTKDWYEITYATNGRYYILKDKNCGEALSPIYFTLPEPVPEVVPGESVVGKKVMLRPEYTENGFGKDVLTQAKSLDMQQGVLYTVSEENDKKGIKLEEIKTHNFMELECFIVVDSIEIPVALNPKREVLQDSWRPEIDKDAWNNMPVTAQQPFPEECIGVTDHIQVENKQTSTLPSFLKEAISKFLEKYPLPESDMYGMYNLICTEEDAKTCLRIHKSDMPTEFLKPLQANFGENTVDKQYDYNFAIDNTIGGFNFFKLSKEQREELLQEIRENSTPQPISGEKTIREETEKLRYDLLEPYAIQELVRVFTEGSRKYADNNWLVTGMPYTRMLASAKRHIAAFELGEDVDQDRQCLHLAMAAWNLLGIVSYSKYFPEMDDRLIHKLNERCKKQLENKEQKKKI